MKSEAIDQLARRLAESLPQGVRAMRDDMEQNFRSILQSGLARLDLVTREEFDVQESVLARTRAKLDALAERLAALEMPPATPKPKKKAKATKAGPKKTAAKKTAGKKTTAAAAKRPRKKATKKKP